MADPDAYALLKAALDAFPTDPDWPDDRQTVTGYELIHSYPDPHTPRDPDVPEKYWAPELGDALPVAQAVTAALLRAIANWKPDTSHPNAMVPPREQLLALADHVEQITAEEDPSP